MKRYLGDAVYFEHDAYNRVELTTEDGIRTTNRIVLEPDTIVSLLRALGECYDRDKLKALLDG